MGVLERFATIMKANVNALLDKAEDPAKMADQILRDLREDLADVKKETANVMAEEKRVQRQLDECVEEIARMESAAKKAVAAGNDDDARILLSKKQSLEAQRPGLEATYQAAKENSEKMRNMHDKLVTDIEELESRKAAIKAKMSVAKAQQSVANATKGMNSAASVEAFERMEAKADRMLDSTSAMLELNKSEKDNNAESIADKYEKGNSDVEDELARLKAELGK